MDYALLDSGEGEKLERFGTHVLRRPDPQALWERRQSDILWGTADAWFERKGEKGAWHFNTSLPKEWPIQYGGMHFLIRLTSFKHVGIFPEQVENWEWVRAALSVAQLAESPRPAVLNLFAYTGGATLAAAKAGAAVTHVDASKTAVEWARKNADLSGIANAPVRWIVDDALTFVRREVKRGVTYDGIILDPPAFGHGPKDELWKIEEDLVPLMRACGDLLSERPRFILMNGYAAGYSHYAFEYLLAPLAERYGLTVTGGELTIPESNSTRLLPAGIFAKAS